MNKLNPHAKYGNFCTHLAARKQHAQMHVMDIYWNTYIEGIRYLSQRENMF